LPWLSGSAAWAYYTAAQFILGIQPDYAGLKIDPCIRSDWNSIKITRRFRNKNFKIKIKNDKGVQKGVKKIILNGNELESNLIPLEFMKDNNDVTVIMG
jgi:cellobiose phosphorylase